jgi:hypothetical protein
MVGTGVPCPSAPAGKLAPLAGRCSTRKLHRPPAMGTSTRSCWAAAWSPPGLQQALSQPPGSPATPASSCPAAAGAMVGASASRPRCTTSCANHARVPRPWCRRCSLASAAPRPRAASTAAASCTRAATPTLLSNALLTTGCTPRCRAQRATRHATSTPPTTLGLITAAARPLWGPSCRAAALPGGAAAQLHPSAAPGPIKPSSRLSSTATGMPANASAGAGDGGWGGVGRLCGYWLATTMRDKPPGTGASRQGGRVFVGGGGGGGGGGQESVSRAERPCKAAG